MSELLYIDICVHTYKNIYTYVQKGVYSYIHVIPHYREAPSGSALSVGCLICPRLALFVTVVRLADPRRRLHICFAVYCFRSTSDTCGMPHPPQIGILHFYLSKAGPPASLLAGNVQSGVYGWAFACCGFLHALTGGARRPAAQRS